MRHGKRGFGHTNVCHFVVHCIIPIMVLILFLMSAKFTSLVTWVAKCWVFTGPREEHCVLHFGVSKFTTCSETISTIVQFSLCEIGEPRSVRVGGRSLLILVVVC